MLAQMSCHRCTARARFVCHVLRAGVDVREFSDPRARFDQSACCKMLLLRHYQHSNTCPRRAWKWVQTFHTRATCKTNVLLGTNILTRVRAEHGDCIVLEHIPDVKRVSGDPVRESPRGDDRWVRREVTHDGSFPHPLETFDYSKSPSFVFLSSPLSRWFSAPNNFFGGILTRHFSLQIHGDDHVTRAGLGGGCQYAAQKRISVVKQSCT